MRSETNTLGVHSKTSALGAKNQEKNIFLIKEEYLSFLIKLIITVAFGLSLWFLYEIGGILKILFLGVFLNLLFTPFLDKTKKYKIPDWLGILLIYLVILILVTVFLFVLIPIFTEQIGKMSVRLFDYIGFLQDSYKTGGIRALGIPDFLLNYLDGFLDKVDFNSLFDFLKNNLGEISKFFGKNIGLFLTNSSGFIFSLTGSLFNFVLIFVFSFFIGIERKKIKKFSYDILPENISKYLKSREDKIISNMHFWLRGQLILSFSIFVLTLLGLNIARLFGINFSFGETFALALIGAMMEFIPYIGPFISILPALAIGATFGLQKILAIILIYIIIQQSEEKVLVPLVMSKSLDLSPLVVLLGMMIGASLFGILGIIIAVPIVSLLQIFVGDFVKWKKGK
ncbi:AI-2E family transporter [Candidatus Gracilibacteria bacterium]|nr:AI-2E family transporter [Candidatus Gracilibacteria bacterium]